MKIELNADETRADFGGSMVVTATTVAEKMDTIQHFRLFDGDPLKAAKAISSKKPLVVTKSGGRDNGAWFQIESSLDVPFSTPYYEELRKRTGYEGRGILPDIGAEFLTPRYPRGPLRYTHYVRGIWTGHGHVCFDALVHSQDWNGRKAGDRAQPYAETNIAREIGDTKIEREFMELGNGLLRRNPNYLRQHAPHPALTAQWFFSALVDWWLANEANEAQRELVRVSGELMKENHNGVSDLHCIRHNWDGGIRHDWNKPVVKWAKFQKLA